MSGAGGWIIERIYQHFLSKEKRIQNDQISPEARATKRLWKFLIPNTDKKTINLSDVKKIRTGWNLMSSMLYKCRTDVTTQKLVVTNPQDDFKLHCLYTSRPDSPKDRCILWFHGGSFILGSPQTDLYILQEITHRYNSNECFSPPSSQLPALVASYRLCPEHTLTESLSDAIALYNHLIQQIPSGNIIIGGNSAGAFLCLLLLHSLQNQNLPSLAILSSLAPYSEIFRLRLADWSSANADDPSLTVKSWTPLNDLLFEKNRNFNFQVESNMKNFPPLYFLYGGDEIVKYGIEQIIEKAKQDNVEVVQREYRGMLHGFLGYFQRVPEANTALNDLVQYISNL